MSSKKNSNGSPCGETEIDLTTIPLDSNDHELMEKLRRQIVDRDSRLKVLLAENAELNEKLKISSAENLEQNRNIEELDKQQQMAIEKVLDVKRGLQDKLAAALEEIKLFQKQKAELVKSQNETIDTIQAEKATLQAQLDQQVASYSELSKITRNYELQMEELSENNLKLEAEIFELKAVVNDTPEVIVNNDECLKKINSLINLNFKLNETFEYEDHFIETFTKWLSSTSARIKSLDFENTKLVDENKLMKEELAKHAYERDNLKSELENYEIECTELMKSNNNLMSDIECLKGGGKLETIMENDDEENIVVLERQLEDSNSLNQSLEDEFHSIRSKLAATEVERSDYLDEVQLLKNQLAENVSRCKIYQEEIDNLENEKSNYLFELNELKSEEERNILMRELKVYKDREIELMGKLDELRSQYKDLFEEHGALEKVVKIQINDLSTTQTKAVEENEKMLTERDDQLTQALTELKCVKEELNTTEKAQLDLVTQLKQNQDLLQTTQNEKELLQARCEELVKASDANLENLKNLNDLVQDLQKKLLESSLTDELNAKISSLEESLSLLNKEKESLIALVTTKHNENVQYHNEIVRLNQLLQQEAQRTENSQSESVQQLNDQVNFLREKCDLLAQNLLQEQNNLRHLQQEKNDAVELNNTLNKDIERLRQHLLEVADAYTFEQVSLQKQVEDYKSKLMSFETEAKKSATAYTSANIRANQQAETLQSQYNLLTQQRDELLAKLSAAEDNDNKNQAALTNLQVALEIFQRGETVFLGC